MDKYYKFIKDKEFNENSKINSKINSEIYLKAYGVCK